MSPSKPQVYINSNAEAQGSDGHKNLHRRSSSLPSNLVQSPEENPNVDTNVAPTVNPPRSTKYASGASTPSRGSRAKSEPKRDGKTLELSERRPDSDSKVKRQTRDSLEDGKRGKMEYSFEKNEQQCCKSCVIL